jgi:hypothetical protein
LLKIGAMKRFLIYALILLCGATGVAAQKRSGRETLTRVPGQDYYFPFSRYRAGFISATEVDPIKGDTTYQIQVSNVIVYGNIGEIRKQRRLIRNVKAVYPYAVDARNLFHQLNEQLAAAGSNRERERITKNLEKELVKRYTPILEDMTFTQGKILLRLIDRETERTGYQIVEEFRGKFSAKFWNTIARIFRANLKQEYDPTQGEDKLIEQIITLYEAGLL